VNLELDDVQAAVKDLYRRLFDEEAGPDVVRSAERDGLPVGLHRRLAATGAFGMAVPAEQGGEGAGMTELCLAAEESGVHVAPVLLVETGVVARLLGRVGAAAALLRPVLDGSQRVGLALRPTVDGWARGVPHGGDVDAVVVFRDDELLFGPVADAEAVATVAGPSSAADCTLDGNQALVLASGPAATQAYEAALDDWRVLTGAVLVGVSQRCLDMAAAYAGERHQFGRPIGSFQSIAHSLADIAVAVDGARLLVYEASWSIDEATSRAASLPAMAYCFAAETALSAAYTALHCHGGYGFMREYDVQLYYRRAAFLSTCAGGARSHLDVVAGRLLPAADGCHGLRG
jgi:alkylation response protein AidB-like acyl-CoA dehydrogenase